MVNSLVSMLTEHNATIFSDEKALLLGNLKQHWSKTKPLAGVRILNNTPVTYETLVKVESLLAAGADLTVTKVKFQEDPRQDIVDLLNRLNVRYQPDHDRLEGEFEIVLDCCAEVMGMKKVQVTKGVVELTQTGGERFKKTDTLFPVINVDDSHLKKLEGMYGTGEAFVRGVKEKINTSIENQHFMVFGFGKVGRGIVKYLLKETRFITIVEQSLEYVSHAKKMGINGLHVSETDKIQHCAREAFALVTATGQMNILSTYVNPKHCPNAYIVNMGAEDEIGEGFQHEKILYQRKAINFSLKHPTLLHFIDPIFYAHNLSAQLLMENTLAGGYHAFPTYLDDLIIQLWNAYYPMDISDIYF